MSDGANYNLDQYVQEKLDRLSKTDKDFKSIFMSMSSESEKIFAETNDGYRITKITYGEFKDRTSVMAKVLAGKFSGISKGSMIGLYMNNCEEWLECFWGILSNGYKPLLMNTRMSTVLLEEILEQYKIDLVISDSKEFSKKTISLDSLRTEVKSENDGVSLENSEWENEIVLMSSGTTNNVKLCVYNGETMYFQICDSANIIKNCKQVKQHYEGELKHLTFLPFYHVFGLVAVFMWFGFFNRTFVFLKDFSSETILNTVRKHKVTHIFSIPLLWDTVYKTVIKTAKERGEYDKLMKGIKISEKLAGTPFNKLFTKLAFKSVREQIFGDSIKFLISGGSAISEDVLRFFNAIGYHLADGYGMTEVGITSVELSRDRKLLNSRSVGVPFASVEYMISEDGELLVKGKTMADIVYEGGKVVDRTENGWFHTNDLAKEINGRYYILGRKDDVIIGASGENINPDVLEDKIIIEGAENVCLVKPMIDGKSQPTLVIKISPYASGETKKNIVSKAKDQINVLGLDGVIGKIILTADPLMEPNDFKLNRKKIAQKISEGTIKASDPEKEDFKASQFTMKVAEIIADVLGKDVSEIGPNADLFMELGGSSLDYFSIIMEVQKEFRVSFPSDQEQTFRTAQQFAEYIEKNR